MNTPLCSKCREKPRATRPNGIIYAHCKPCRSRQSSERNKIRYREEPEFRERAKRYAREQYERRKKQQP